MLRDYIDSLGLEPIIFPMADTFIFYYKYFLEWLVEAIDINYTFRDFIIDILKILYKWFFGA